MKPFKDQGWLYYDKCKTIMYASKAQGGCAFFAGVGSAVTSASQASSSSNIATAFTTESTISNDHGTPATDLDFFIKNFGEIWSGSLYLSERVKTTNPVFWSELTSAKFEENLPPKDIPHSDVQTWA